MRRRGLTTMTGALLAAALLSGCASAGPGADAGTGGATPTVSAELELGAAWVDGGRMIAVTTWGSSTCIPVAEAAELEGDVLAVTLADPAPQGSEVACTLDNVQRATLVPVPEGVDPTQDLGVQVTYASAGGRVELAGAAGAAAPATPTDYAPSAGWVDDATVALVTWGSSGCPPVIEDVQAATATEIAVTFATPPADRICTMDMAPRVALAVADGVERSDGTEVVLQGDTFDGVRVPVLG